MKKIINAVCSFIKAHMTVFICSTAAVAAIGTGVGIVACVRNSRPGNQETPRPSVQAKHEHVYTSEEIPATCGHGGYTLFSCKCGAFYKENESEAQDHEFGEWTVTIAATMEMEGEKEQRCLHCNARNTEIIPKIEEHDHIFNNKVVKATCTEKGYTAQTCTICGFQTADKETNALGHSWASWTVKKAATATTPGEKTRVCTACGKTETESIPISTTSEHKHSYTATVVEATCSSGGYTRHTCSCGHAYNTDTTPVRSHLYGNWVVTKQATENSPGTRTASCSRCGNEITETIPQLSLETVDKYENYIDPRIEVLHRSDGATGYFYNDVTLIDTRTWGDPPAIHINGAGGFHVVYLQPDGSRVERDVSPVAGYVSRLVINQDGSFITSLIGDFNN